MYKHSIVDNSIASLYQIINEINETHPLWWQEFLENIIHNPKVTFINHTTIIIGLYELGKTEIMILYNVLKKFKKEQLLTKVINKKEFLIVHFKNLEIMEYIISPIKWLNLVVYEYLSEEYETCNLILNPDTEETLRLIYQGTIYHFLTDPSKVYKSNKYHKYIYLYNNLYVKHLNLVDNHLKYIRNKQEFIKKFKTILEKSNY